MQNSCCTHAPYTVPCICVCASHCSCGLRLACHMPHGAAGVAATYGQSKHMCCSPIRVFPELVDLLMLCFGPLTTSKPLWTPLSSFPSHPHLTGARRKKLGTKKREQRTVLHTFHVLSRFLCVKKIFPYDKETKQKDRKTNKQISTKVKRKRKLKIK